MQQVGTTRPQTSKQPKTHKANFIVHDLPCRRTAKPYPATPPYHEAGFRSASVTASQGCTVIGGHYVCKHTFGLMRMEKDWIVRKAQQAGFPFRQGIWSREIIHHTLVWGTAAAIVSVNIVTSAVAIVGNIATRKQ